MRDIIPYNFGCLQPLPEGYTVCWYESHEHYQAAGPDDWEGNISVDPYWCRRQALWHFQKQQAARAVAGLTQQVSV